MTVKRLLASCLLALVVVLPAQADTQRQQLATQAALDGLFSMPQVQPEGSERVEPPKGFGGAEAGEEELIQYLAAQKRLGADLNAYRHLGTPLHHAIRGGLHDTARWLLKNGANPQLRVQGDGAHGAYPGPDAWGVAVSVSAWKLLDEMRRLPVFKALSADDQARAVWPYALDAADKTAMLLSKRIAPPNFSTLPQLADALLLHSLCTGQPRLAQAMLGQSDAPAQPAAVRRPGEPCGVVVAGNVSKPTVPLLPATEWKAIEERLQWPLLPFLAAQAQTPSQVAQWLAAGLRKPWSEPIATTQYVWSAIWAVQPAAVALLHAMPPASLQVELRDPRLMTAWLRLAADWPLADLRWALVQVDAGLLAGKLAPVMQDWSYAKATGREAKDAKDRIARWALLTDRLAAPLPAVPSDGFLYWVPIELWPRWFALGFRVDDAHWANWFGWSDPAPFEQAWPLIAKHQPAVAQRTVEWLVAQLSVGPAQDPQTKRLSYGSETYYYDQSFLRKAKFLQAQHAQAPQPRWLAGAYADISLAPGVAFALAQNWVRVPPATLRAQMERAPLNCQARPSAALRRSLASGSPLKVEDDGSYEGDFVQPIARSGETACGWLVTGSTSGGRRFINEESFSEGVQRLTPCTEGSASAALWNEARSAWMPVTDMSQGALIPIRLKSGGEVVFASTEVEYGGCGGKSGSLLMPRFAPDGGLQLELLAPGHPLFDALALQCDFRGLSACLGITEGSAHPADALAVPTFIDKAWAKEKSAFLGAVDRLDRAALNQARADGMLAGWLDEALRRTSASQTLALPEKRQRIAWVFAQRAPRPVFAQETLETLVPWMPPEDWGPVLSALRCTNRYVLNRVAEQAQAKNLAALHRRVQAALATPCGAGKQG